MFHMKPILLNIKYRGLKPPLLYLTSPPRVVPQPASKFLGEGQSKQNKRTAVAWSGLCV